MKADSIYEVVKFIFLVFGAISRYSLKFFSCLKKATAAIGAKKVRKLVSYLVMELSSYGGKKLWSYGGKS